MGYRENFPERRKEKRFELKDAAYAVIYFSKTEMYRIIDISRGGLAIRHVKRGKCPNKLDELDIFKPDFSFYLQNIKARKISDTELIDNAPGPEAARRSGIRFLDMSSTQISQLENFIQKLALDGKLEGRPNAAEQV